MGRSIHIYYPFRRIKIIFALWKEWNLGIEGNSSTSQLDKQYANKWRLKYRLLYAKKKIKKKKTMKTPIKI